MGIDGDTMMPTMLYITLVLYDSFEEQIFIERAAVNKLTLHYYNNAHNNLNDLRKLKLELKLENSAEGSILLGSLD